MLISDLADADDNIAFAAFYSFVAPAMWQRMTGDLRWVLHGGANCGQVRPAGLPGHDDVDLVVCPECQTALDERLCGVFATLRAALSGKVPVTTASRGAAGSGDAVEVGEWRLVVDHIHSGDATAEDAAAFAAMLRELPMDRPSPGHPAWLRAAKAQIVLFPNEHLRAALRRREAVAAGRAARPDRDLRTAKWAASLRTDSVSFALLVCFLRRLHAGTADPRTMPEDVVAEHGLTPATAARRLNGILAELQQANPGFYTCNVATPLACHDETQAAGSGGACGPASSGPEEVVVAAEASNRHRGAILAAIAADTPPAYPRRRGRGSSVLAVLAVLVEVGYGRNVDVIAACVRRGLDAKVAAELVAELAGIVMGAGVRWVDMLLHTLDERARRPA